MFRNFLVLCGPEAVSLKLHVSSGDAGSVMGGLENIPDFQMSKLTTLEFHFLEDNRNQVKLEANQVHGYAKLVGHLLAAAKTLRELELSYPSCYIPAYRVQQGVVFQQLSSAIAKALPSSVKQLKLRLNMNESGFNTLAGIQPQLERFQYSSYVLESRTLHQFLQSQAATLKHFRIFGFLRRGDGIFVQFPRLDELVHLDLPDCTVSTTTPSNFAETFPKLQCLKIPRMELETHFPALLSCVKTPSRSLKVLHLPRWRSTPTGPLVKDVAKSFPCLTELHVQLLNVTKEVMGEVFTYFDNLEVLDISFEFSDRVKNANWAESLFSGIAESDCFRVRRLQDFENENVSELHRQPSILNMTKLRKLVIDTYGEGDRFSFTDFSAHFIFLEMDSLREIHLPVGVVKFSPKYLELLRDKLVLRG